MFLECVVGDVIISTTGVSTLPPSWKHLWALVLCCVLQVRGCGRLSADWSLLLQQQLLLQVA